jgi:serine/threonine-protein kinase RsbT
LQFPWAVSTPNFETRLVDVLSRFLSPINAGVVAERSRRVLQDRERIAPSERERFLRALRSGAALFMSARELSELEQAVQTEITGAVPATVREIPINNEDDLRMARLTARDMALALRSSSLSAQRIATAVSELGRNIVAYTPGGMIRLEPVGKRLRIVASDRGHGIAHLQEVFSGNYRSKTGLGRGLMGIRKMMEHFDIETGPKGTRITVEAAL